jgi:uncharacterized protein
LWQLSKDLVIAKMADEKNRAWVRLESGGKLDLISPKPTDWTNADLAERLSHTYRWGGASVWELPLSVAQHSLLVLQIRESLSPAPLSSHDALRELLHDAEKGFLCFDCIALLKVVLGQAFRAVTARLTAAVNERYALGHWEGDDYRRHKEADDIAAASEAFYCAGWSEPEIRNTLGITQRILKEDPLLQLYGGSAWEPWPAKLSASRFLNKLEFLLNPLNPVSEHSKEFL